MHPVMAGLDSESFEIEIYSIFAVTRELMIKPDLHFANQCINLSLNGLTTPRRWDVQPARVNESGPLSRQEILLE